jgi:hypothetical protein
MAGCAPIQFQDITRARFNCLQQAASQQLNVILKGDSGSASDPGGTNTIYGDHFVRLGCYWIPRPSSVPLPH